MNPAGIPASTNGYFKKREKYVDKLLDYGDWMKFIVAGHGNIWGYLLKKEIIENLNLKFNEKVLIAEDVLFLMKYIIGRKGIFLQENTYMYRYQRPDSLSNVRKIGELEVVSCIEFLKECREREAEAQNNNFSEGVDFLTEFMARRCLGLLCHLPKKGRKEKLKALKKMQPVLSIDKRSFSELIVRFLYNYMPFIYLYI